MTALAGFFSFYPGDHPEHRLCLMLEAQAVFGRDPAVCVQRDGIALGRRLTPLLPEDAHDPGPVSGGDGRLLLVGDVRLENREELGAALALGAEAKSLCDAAVALKAWEQWGEETPDHLGGAFAFALWDSRAQQLTLVRDPFGHRPLFLHRGRGFAAFASMPAGLHALAEVPYKLDDETLLRFIDLAPLGSAKSFYAGIEQVPAGHMVTIRRDLTETRRYWSPSLEPIRLRRSEDYVEAVRELLDRAVAACLRGAGSVVGAHLSAGLDSAGVAATAARMMGGGGRVVGFTAVPRPGFAEEAGPAEIVDEGPLAAATAAYHPNIEHVRVRASGKSPLAEFERSFRLFQAPLPNPCNYVWASAIQDEARARGLRVLLTGQFGNLTFSHDGSELLPALLRSGRLRRLVREAWALRRAGLSLRGLAGSTVGPLLSERSWRRLSALRGTPQDRESFSLARASSRPAQQSDAGYAYRPRVDAAYARLQALRELDFGGFNKGILAGWGLDVRDPTADRRLVEFCLRVPSDQFLSGGVRRSLARRVLADRLPSSVLGETRRGRQSADWPEMLDAAHRAILDEVRRIEDSAEASSLIDTGRLRGLVTNWPEQWGEAGQERLYRGALLRALSAGHFARRTAEHAETML